MWVYCTVSKKCWHSSLPRPLFCWCGALPSAHSASPVQAHISAVEERKCRWHCGIVLHLSTTSELRAASPVVVMLQPSPQLFLPTPKAAGCPLSPAVRTVSSPNSSETSIPTAGAAARCCRAAPGGARNASPSWWLAPGRSETSNKSWDGVWQLCVLGTSCGSLLHGYLRC